MEEGMTLSVEKTEEMGRRRRKETSKLTEAVGRIVSFWRQVVRQRECFWVMGIGGVQTRSA